MKAKWLLFFLVLIGVLLLAQAALAKGPPQKVTISGEGLLSEIILVGDTDKLGALGMMVLEDYTTRSANAPESISGEGYLITRFFEESPKRYVAFDSVRYYPDPAGGSGYINFLGITGGSSDYDGKWFRASPQGEAILKDLIADGQAATRVARSAVKTLFLKATAAFLP